MKPSKMLEELEHIARGLDVRVSYEKLNSSIGFGGMCRVKGKLRIIVDKRASTHERVATLGGALGSLDTENVDASPKVAELLGYYRQLQLRAAS